MKAQGRTTSHKQHFAALISSTPNPGMELTLQCLSLTLGAKGGQGTATRGGRERSLLWVGNRNPPVHGFSRVWGL